MAPTSEPPLRARLTAVRYATPDVSFFEFKALNGETLPSAAPGAHIDVWVADGLQRQYSLISPFCAPSTYVVAVRREANGKGGSLRLHDASRVGQIFGIGAPRNHFPLVETADETLLLAGGIGITPIFSMFAHLKARGAPATLHYWTRSADSAVFLDELSALGDVTLHYSRDANRTVASLSQVLQGIDDRTEVYCCGPDRMLRDFEQLTSRRPAGKNHVERFGAAVPAETAEKDDASFVVRLDRSGREVRVAADETILNALLRENVDVSYSCEEGVCGACETRVLQGEACHRDVVYSAEEHARRGSIMICCSRARDDLLVLDL